MTNTTDNIEILTAAEVLSRGLIFVGFSRSEQEVRLHEVLVKEFRAHYGSSPVDLARIWNDVQTTEFGEPLEAKDKSAKGFKMFMAAMHFL